MKKACLSNHLKKIHEAQQSILFNPSIFSPNDERQKPKVFLSTKVNNILVPILRREVR